jgi:DNA-binding transcriptional regulator YiaG
VLGSLYPTRIERLTLKAARLQLHATLIEKMANRHSLMWRAPGRRSAEREKFRRLMKKVEAVRVREGMTKTELAAELGANVDGVRAWMTGRTVGRKETVDKIKDFLKRKS